jgi:hypothetical protein
MMPVRIVSLQDVPGEVAKGFSAYVRPLPVPVPARGSLGLWEWEPA